MPAGGGAHDDPGGRARIVRAWLPLALAGLVLLIVLRRRR